MKDESTVQQEVQIIAKHYRCHLMRNNSGALLDDTGRLVRYGLGNSSKQHQERVASSDLIGFTQVEITPDMVGKTLAIFTAIEVKKEAWNENKKFDKRETAQSNFIEFIKLMGGFAGFANSQNKLKEILNHE